MSNMSLVVVEVLDAKQIPFEHMFSPFLTLKDSFNPLSYCFQAVVSTAGTRVFLPAPLLIIPPIIMNALEK